MEHRVVDCAAFLNYDKTLDHKPQANPKYMAYLKQHKQ